jgi:hypothetical protein
MVRVRVRSVPVVLTEEVGPLMAHWLFWRVPAVPGVRGVPGVVRASS